MLLLFAGSPRAVTCLSAGERLEEEVRTFLPHLGAKAAGTANVPTNQHQPSRGDPSNHHSSDKSGPGRCETQSRSISLSLTPSGDPATPAPAPEILYMEGEQGLRCLLLQPRAVERQVADLLSLSVEQKGPRGRWGHVGPGRGPDAGRCDAGETWHINGGGRQGERWLGEHRPLSSAPKQERGAALGARAVLNEGDSHTWGAKLLHGGVLPGSERVPWISLPLSSTHQQYPLSPWHCSGVNSPPASHCGTYWSLRGLPP